MEWTIARCLRHRRLVDAIGFYDFLIDFLGSDKLNREVWRKVRLELVLHVPLNVHTRF